MRIPAILCFILVILQPQKPKAMFKTQIIILCAVVSMLAFSRAAAAQNVDVQSVTISAGASTCTVDTATVGMYIGCINFGYDSIAADVSGDTLNIRVYYTGYSICYGAISYPPHSVEIPSTSYGTYTVIAKAYQSGTLTDTYTTTTTFTSCDPASEFEMSDSVICAGDSLWMTNYSQASNQYYWFVNGQYLSQDSNEAYLFGNSGFDTITLVATDGTLYDTSSQVIHVLNSAPIISLGADTLVCPLDSILLDAGAGYTSYAWSTGDSTQGIERAVGLYMVTVSEDGSCNGMDTINLTQIYVPDLIAMQTSASACTELEIGTSNSFPSYNWSTGSSDSTITVQTSGTYTVTATSAEGCEKVDEITVEVLDAPINNLGNDTTMCSDISWSLSLNADTSGTYLWQDASTNGYYLVVNAPGIYWLSITAENGCATLDSIIIDEKKCTVGIPSNSVSGFTIYPNPASNDLHLSGLNGTASITITDQAGRIVLTESDMNNENVLDVQRLSEGVYFIEIMEQGLKQVQRVIITH